jgi:Arc/MetJ family transcription regulator
VVAARSPLIDDQRLESSVDFRADGARQARGGCRPCAPECADSSGRLREGRLRRQRLPYRYGIIVWMKKTLHIDERLLRDAKSASGAKTDPDAVRLGLEALVRHGAYQRLHALRGSEPKAREAPRRRERLSSAKHSAA